LGEGYVFALAHLSLGLLYESTFFRSQNIVGINHAFWFDEHTVRLSGERYKVPFLELEGFEHVARDHHLPALSDASDPLFSASSPCLKARNTWP
jgi:hypothetical protein